MTRRLLDYNPETEGAEGNLLLFGVPTYLPMVDASKELEELDLASAFLDAGNARQLSTVVNRLLQQGGKLSGHPLGLQVAERLVPRLVRAGQSLRTLLTPPAGRSDSSGATEIMERVVGAELEGLSAEDREFETARSFVRFAIEAARIAAKAPPTHPPTAIATAAARVAARRFAPGLFYALRPTGFRARRAFRRLQQLGSTRGVIAMHDIDRTQLEFTQEVPYQSEEFEFQEFEGGMMEMNENEEIQLAHELLSVNNEQELEQFLGDFIKKAVSTVSSIAKSPVGQAIGGVLKGVAKKALPMAGQALGGYIGGPLGAKIGTGLANAAGKAIGLEFEFGENEELEVTGARKFVKIAQHTAKQAAQAAAAGGDPRQAAQQAAVAAARKLAPGLLSGGGGGMQSAGGMQPAGDSFGDMQTAGGAPGAGAAGAHRRGHSGRWVRHGRRIVVLGV